MAPKEADISLWKIDYKLNMLGVRVTPESCQLIAKSRMGWVTIGLPRRLPIQLPQDRDEMRIEVDSPLRITAFQYIAAHPGTDLADVLSQIKPFEQALKENQTVMA